MSGQLPTETERVSDLTLAQYAEWAETRATEEKIPVMVNFHLTLASALRELQRLRSSGGARDCNCIGFGLTRVHDDHCPTRRAPEPSEIQRLRGQLEAADHAADACMKERDDAEEQADRLAECIADLLGIDIGEHSSGNAPWQNAIDAAEYELDKRRRSPEPSGGQWRPIEAAPKDGTRVLCAFCENETPEVLYFSGGMWYSELEREGQTSFIFLPTYWMPLPELPRFTSTKEAGQTDEKGRPMTYWGGLAPNGSAKP